MVRLFCIGVAFLTSASVVRANLVNISALKDNTLYENDFGSLSNGAGEWMFAGKTLQGPRRRAVMAFDINSVIPSGSTVNSATLTLHMSKCGTTCGLSFAFDLHQISQDWGEGVSDAGNPGGEGTASEAGDATWIHTFYGKDVWTNAGGDFAAPVSATKLVGDTGFYSWSSAAMVADVQSWVGVSSSFGWILIGDELDTRSARRFDTHENLIPSFRPVLKVDYTPAPEPATLLFVGIGMVAVLRNKRSLNH